MHTKNESEATKGGFPTFFSKYTADTGTRTAKPALA